MPWGTAFQLGAVFTAQTGLTVVTVWQQPPRKARVDPVVQGLFFQFHHDVGRRAAAGLRKSASTTRCLFPVKFKPCTSQHCRSSRVRRMLLAFARAWVLMFLSHDSALSAFVDGM